ncbi:MAG: hydroxymethylbilane synthase [Coriobacteriia bacterium]|nr:hydroxymethylbilane synthase [Coriobacteriia bacterium]
MRNKLVLGTRGSALALWQANWIKELMEAASGLPVEIHTIKTTGDKITDVPLAKVGGKGLFTKEIEVELADGRIDLAVHSMKDVPTELPAGLVLAGMPPRADSHDVLVAHAGENLLTLPQGGRVGTSSLRRISQVRALRPDVEIVDVRGNLDTRMRKAEEGAVDLVILAAAGIKRLGWGERITATIPTEQMVSAVGQGAVGIEIRGDDELMAGLCAQISDADTLACVRAERVVMNLLEGGCQVPIGAYARFADDKGSGTLSRRMVLDALVGSVDGKRIVRTQVEGAADSGEELGQRAVEELKAGGALPILNEIRQANGAAELL